MSTLNQVETTMVAGLPESLRQGVIDALLKAKAESQAKADLIRKTFGLSVSTVVKQQPKDGKPQPDKKGSGGVKTVGLNMRFPITLQPEQYMTVFERIDEYRDFFKANRALIEATRGESYSPELISWLDKQ
jgi:hypothetical protein